jgi:hypothetical protein
MVAGQRELLAVPRRYQDFEGRGSWSIGCTSMPGMSASPFRGA